MSRVSHLTGAGASQPAMHSSGRGRLLVAFAIIALVIFSYAGAFRAVVRPWVELPDVPGGVSGQTFLLLLFSLLHASYALGWRHTLVFFGITAVVSWAFEQVGVATGAVYGPYYYTDFLGFKLGHVPLLIPLAWFMMIYPSYVIANLIAQDRPTGSPRGLGGLLWLAFLSAMVMTAWDLVVDPFLSGPEVAAWVWTEGGPYFGIPVQNFIGWMLTTFTVYTLYRLYERRFRRQPEGAVTRGMALLPLLAYGSIMISNMLSSGPDALHVIAPFAMGLPLVMALTRLAHYRVQAGQWSLQAEQAAVGVESVEREFA